MQHSLHSITVPFLFSAPPFGFLFLYIPSLSNFPFLGPLFSALSPALCSQSSHVFFSHYLSLCSLFPFFCSHLTLCSSFTLSVFLSFFFSAPLSSLYSSAPVSVPLPPPLLCSSVFWRRGKGMLMLSGLCPLCISRPFTQLTADNCIPMEIPDPHIDHYLRLFLINIYYCAKFISLIFSYFLRV